ncbi:MAG: isochorismatase family protein [Pseudomonadota bacterium]|jgi:nicotinamidase-related amidase
MSSIVDIRSFFAPRAAPTLVLMDMQQEYVSGSRMLAIKDNSGALRNCRSALDHARRLGFPVAFVRWSGRSTFFNAATPYYRWIDDFSPHGSDMVFERDRPSCFSSPLFADVMANAGGPIILAGFSGEGACLSTAVDAFHRSIDFTFLADASASHAVGDKPEQEVHAMLSSIIGLYGVVSSTTDWIDSTLALKSHERRNGLAPTNG